MRNSSLFPILVALLICIYPFFVTGVSSQSSDRIDPFTGQIVWIESKERKGALMIRQVKGGDLVDGAEGMLVRRGYMLILAPTARATVVCGDGKERELTPGPQGCPCTKPCIIETCGPGYEGSRVVRMRGIDTDKGLFPVVISPRKTMLKNLRPTIRWTPVISAKGSPTYKVAMYGEGMKEIWAQQGVSETRLRYPDKAPPLKPGQIYKVIVTSGGLSSEREQSPDLGFTTLATNEARALADEESEKKKMRLPERQTRLLISNLYAARELYSEAIEQLEGLDTTMKAAATARMLGDLYMMIGLSREAEKRYLEALNLIPASDLDGLGLTQRNLAQVYEQLGIYDQAIARLEEAMESYRRLGRADLVKSLQDEVQKLKRSGGTNDRSRSLL